MLWLIVILVGVDRTRKLNDDLLYSASDFLAPDKYKSELSTAQRSWSNSLEADRSSLSL